MRSEAAIRRMIEHIEADERHRAKTAIVQVNAPLALIQVELGARLDALQWVLGERAHGGGSAGSLPREPADER